MANTRQQYKGANHTKVSIYYQDDNDENGQYSTWVVSDNLTSSGNVKYYFYKKMAYIDYNKRVKAIKTYSKAIRNGK